MNENEAEKKLKKVIKELNEIIDEYKYDFNGGYVAKLLEDIVKKI